MFSTRTILMIATIVAVGFAGGCGGGEDPTGPDPAVGDLLAEAIDSLEQAMLVAVDIDEMTDLDQFSFDRTNELFAQALAASPSNDTAAVGVAITTIFMLEDDPQLRAAAEQWEDWINDGPDPVGPLAGLFGPATPLRWAPVTLPLDFSGADVRRLASTGLVAAEVVRSAGGPALAPSPSITAHQALLVNVVIPALDDALDALSEITNDAFVFTVTEAMQGEEPQDADPLELDYTEVLALKAGLEVAIASIDIATAYRVDPNPLSVSGFVSAMTPGSTFLTLATGGGARLSDGLTRLQSATDLLLDGLDELEAETDNQDNDIIKYDPTGTGDGVTADDVDEARDLIADVQDALSAPTTVVLEEGTPNEVSFQLDARRFFTNPITDLKAVLPDYEVFSATEVTEAVSVFRWTELNLTDWTFPDATFNGILPGMTRQKLIDDFGADDFFFENNLAGGFYRLITVNGVDCLTSLNTGGQGCLVNGVYYYDGNLSLTGFDGASSAYLDVYGSGSSIFEEGPYTVVDNTTTYGLTFSWTTSSSATLLDRPGYTSVDAQFRQRGGSRITLSYLSRTWVFER